MSSNYRELVIADLADSEAALRDVNRQLIELVADLTLENIRLRYARDTTLTALRDRLMGQLDHLAFTAEPT